MKGYCILVFSVMVTMGDGAGEEGGLRFEVILKDAKTKKVPRPKSAPVPAPKKEEIQQRLQVTVPTQGFY